MNDAALDFARDGVAVIAGVLTPAHCDALCDRVAQAVDASGAPGTRSLLAQDWCRTLAAGLRAHPGIAPLVGAGHVAVQCTYFEKSAGRNWLVPIHQDLAIPVAARVDHPGLRGWSYKDGSLFVQPPAEVLEQLVAVRVHLDPCHAQDGPLRFLPGTQKLGRIGAADAGGFKSGGAMVAPVLERGDVLAMRPLVLHASSRATGTGRRRVLHFVFGPASLPHGLAWEFAL